MRGKLHLFSFILLFPFFLQGQSYLGKVIHYGIEQGLSHRDVQCIKQDRQGLIWLGTKYGLNRFDGKNFKWYTKEKQGLQSNEINHILEDKSGRLWLIYSGSFLNKAPQSIDILDPVNEKFVTFKDLFGDAFSLSDIVNFGQNATGELCFLTKANELVFYDGDFKTLSIKLDDYYDIQNLQCAPNGWIWLTVRSLIDDLGNVGILILAFDDKGKEVRRLSHIDYHFGFVYNLEEVGKSKYLVTKLNEPTGPQVHAFYSNELGQIIADQTLQTKLIQSQFQSEYLSDMNQLIGQNGNFLWLGGDNNVRDKESNLNIFDLGDSLNVQWGKDLQNISYGTAILFDDQGDTWISSQFGLYYIKLKENNFTKILNPQKETFAIRGIMTGANRLWMVEEGIPSFWNISIDAIQKGTKTFATEYKLPSGNSAIGLGKGKSGKINYASTIKLESFNPNTFEHTSNIIDTSLRASRNGFWAFHEDEFGKTWFTTGEADIGFRDSDKFHWLPPIDSIIAINHIYQFLVDKNGLTWLFSDLGLFILNTKKGVIEKRFWSGAKGENYFPFDKIYHGYEDEEGAFWLGSAGNGLLKWENPGQPGGWTQYTKADGLSNNTIYAVYPDEYGNLWLASDYGIMKFNKESLTCQTFLKEDGITHNEFNRISHYQSEDGHIFFGGLNGVTAFHPNDFQEKTTSNDYPLVITDYQHYDNSGTLVADKKQVILNNNEIIFQPNDQFFRLDFTLLTYDEVDKIQYAYKVEGADKNWTYQKENYIRFSRLPYGEYTLRIKGQAANGQWSQKELAITLKVLKPFYLQVWFLILATGSIFLGAFIFYKWRVNSLKERQKELEQIVKERTRELVEDKKVIEKQATELQSLERLKSRFFANVSHELRTPLTLMLGPVNTLIKRKNSNEQDGKLLQFIQRNGNQLLKLINEILDLSKLESGKLEVAKEAVDFYDFLNTLLAQFYSFADSEQVNLALDFQLDKSLQLLLDRGKIEKIIQNYLSNAMKYTPIHGRIVLKVFEIENQIQLSVKDTGVGIHSDDLPHIFDRFYQAKKDTSTPKGGTGIGLSLVKELAELLEGKVWAESEFGKGSVFYFQFPKEVAGSKLMVTDLDSDSDSNFLQMENKATKKEQKTKPSSESKPATSNQPLATILLVEDNPDLREYITILLSDYNVITAENGQVGLNCLLETQTEKTGGCQLIISDLMMPVMDGFEFLEKVKSDDRWRHIPVIMLTAKVNVKAKLNALRIGVDDYLTKPFVEEELRARIENLLRNYRERMELFSQNSNETGEQEVPNRPVIAEVDAQWLGEVEAVLNKLLSESKLTMNRVAEELYISHRQMSRKIKKLTGLTASQYLQEMRLQQAKEYLHIGKYATVKEVSYAVGFADTRYFSELFQRHFGKQPSSFLH